jgi:hypothetical protein
MTRTTLWASCLTALALGAATVSADDAPAPAAPPSPAAPAAGSAAGGSPAGAPPAEASAPSAGKTFSSREEAAKALFTAMEKNDDAALKEILGPGNEDLAQDGRDEAVRPQRALLAKTAAEKTAFDEQDGRTVILIGEKDYPLAIPLSKDADGWRFDAAAGRRELLARRVGEHELEAIAIALAVVDAQAEYASRDRDGDGVLEYAQRLSSTPGRHDGLWWASAEGDEESPAGSELAALKDAPQDPASKAPPFDGYYWRILSAQGETAPGGARSWVVGEDQTAGFAVLAVPALHRNTGVKSFLVGRDGKVFEKDLGADGLRTAAEIVAFAPDASWSEVDAETIQRARTVSPEDAPFSGPSPADAVATGGGGSDGLPAPQHVVPQQGVPQQSGAQQGGAQQGPAPAPPSSPCRPR